jgi:para-aminobenzoate synthetase component 1
VIPGWGFRQRKWRPAGTPFALDVAFTEEWWPERVADSGPKPYHLPQGMMGTAAVILLEHGPTGAPVVFAAPSRVIVAHRSAEVAPALAAAEGARAKGAWVAGYIAYEAGFALEPKLARLMPRRRPGPLVALGIFDAPGEANTVLAQAAEEGRSTAITAPQPAIGRRAYGNAARKVFAYIAAGDCYQVNLTFPMTTTLLSGTPLGLYGALRRTGAVGHGAYVDPARDAAIAAALQASVKDRAENLMIVDLLRNDIARIARVGSVKVPALFAMERYSTVHQMTSTVEGQLAEAPSLPALMAALFPCGSVTGAPKIRAMEIIREVEPAARGIYCGAIGWMSPAGQADFSVAIRTLSVTGQDIVMNVGGGLTHGSTADGEWEEALWKARFVKAAVSRA